MSCPGQLKTFIQYTFQKVSSFEIFVNQPEAHLLQTSTFLHINPTLVFIAVRELFAPSFLSNSKFNSNQTNIFFDKTRVHKHKLLVEQKHSFKLKHPIPGFVVRIEMFHMTSKVAVHVVSPHGITSARSIDIDLNILLAVVIDMHIYADTK